MEGKTTKKRQQRTQANQRKYYLEIREGEREREHERQKMGKEKTVHKEMFYRL